MRIYGYHISYGLSYQSINNNKFSFKVVSSSVYFFPALCMYISSSASNLTHSLQVNIIRTLSPEIISFYLYWYHIHMSGYHLSAPSLSKSLCGDRGLHPKRGAS